MVISKLNTTKKTTVHADENPCPGWEQAYKSGGIKPFNEIHLALIDNL